MRRGAWSRDDGSASVLVLAAALAVVTFVTVVAAMAGTMVAVARARAAADLAALAGAVALGRGDDACRRAAAIARANGAVLERCALGGGAAARGGSLAPVVVEVVVRVPARLPLARGPTARARAGLDTGPGAARRFNSGRASPDMGDVP